MRFFKSVILIVMLLQNSPLKTDELNICPVVDSPSKFNRQFITVEGMASKVDKSTARAGSKETTFVLRNLSGCSARILYSTTKCKRGRLPRFRDSEPGTFDCNQTKNGGRSRPLETIGNYEFATATLSTLLQSSAASHARCRMI
jgi:hypothetical protein